MSLQCGIVGLPNVGKSTLFNALTKAGIAAENYPFCTIEPNVGVVELPDPRLAQLTEREREVLEQIALGATNSEIAGTLYMAEGTVKTHIGRLLAKLRCRDRVGLVLFAYETGVVSR